MLNQKMKTIAKVNRGKLPSYTDLGGYPLFYVNNHNNVLCPACANRHKEYDETIVDYDINYEDAMLMCDQCNQWIDPAYLDEEELQAARNGEGEA